MKIFCKCLGRWSHRLKWILMVQHTLLSKLMEYIPKDNFQKYNKYIWYLLSTSKFVSWASLKKVLHKNGHFKFYPTEATLQNFFKNFPPLPFSFDSLLLLNRFNHQYFKAYWVILWSNYFSFTVSSKRDYFIIR